jgi:hypothetical protein
MTPKCYRTCLRCAILVGWCLVGMMPSPLCAETPTQALQETIDRFQTLLHDQV